ncbi:MAG: hypothetical protein AAGH42_10380 [Pseudomonadota bacterium]
MSPILIVASGVITVLLGVSTWRAPRLTSVIVWALIATIFFTAALLIKLPGDFANTALWMTLAVPLIWVGFQFICYWDKKGWRAAASLITVSVISAAIVFTSAPIG